MRRTPRTLLLAATLAASGLLVACVPQDPAPTPSTTKDPPRFASEEEALAAAEEAYGRFIDTLDAISADGGHDSGRLLDVASRPIVEFEEEGFRTLRDRELRATGTTTYSIHLQSYSGSSVSVYACEDLSSTDLIDKDGESVRSPDGNFRFIYEVGIKGEPLIVDTRVLWTGTSPCEF